MKIKLSQLASLRDAHLALGEGTDEIARLESGKERVVRKPFVLSVKARWGAAKNMKLLTRELEAYGEARERVLSEATGGKYPKGFPPITEKMLTTEIETINALRPAAELKVAELNAQETEIANLLRFKFEDIRDFIERGHPAVIEVLMPLIDGEPE